MGNRVADLKKDGDHYSAGKILAEKREMFLSNIKRREANTHDLLVPEGKKRLEMRTHGSITLCGWRHSFIQRMIRKKMAEKERLERQKALVLQAKEAKKERRNRKSKSCWKRKREKKTGAITLQEEEERKKQEQQRLWKKCNSWNGKRSEKQRNNEKRKKREKRRSKEKTNEELQKKREREQAEKERREKAFANRKKTKAKRVSQKEQNPMVHTLLTNWQEQDDENAATKSLAALDEYRYFDADQIIASAEDPGTGMAGGPETVESGKNECVVCQYGALMKAGQVDEQMGQAAASVGKERNQFSATAPFSKNELLNLNCGCPQCRKLQDYYRCGALIRAQNANMQQRYFWH